LPAASRACTVGFEQPVAMQPPAALAGLGRAAPRPHAAQPQRADAADRVEAAVAARAGELELGHSGRTCPSIPLLQRARVDADG